MSSTVPPGSEPDYLQTGPSEPGQPSRGGRGRRVAMVGGGTAVLLLVGGGVWAWNFWFNQGPQPAEALPADTLAYVAIDLDPSGEQQIEAVEALRKFSVIEEELDFDLNARDDIKKWIFQKVQEEDGTCPEIDYDDDLKPWLGDRFGFAVVEVDDEPRPVAVLQVTDEGEAGDGIERLLECADEEAGYAVDGDWAIVAETEEIAREVLDSGKDDNLADDEDYQELTEAAGDPGVVTVYAAPEAGAALMDAFGTEMVDELAGLGGMTAEGGFADDLRASMEGFGGAAGTMRFADGDLELEFVAGEFRGDLAELAPFRTAAIGSLVSRLPEASAAAIAFGVPDGYVDTMLETVRPMIEMESGLPYDEAIAELEAVSGLSLPEDLDALLGDAVALVADSDIDPDEVESQGPAAVRAALLVRGDADEIERVLDKIRTRVGPEVAPFLNSEADGDLVAIGANADYLDEVISGGDLGDDAVFEKVVPQGDDSSVVFYVDFDRNDWLVELAEGTGAPEEIVDNLEPLEAFGLSAWEDDGRNHFLLKLATD